MRARELAAEVPTVMAGDPATHAVRVMVDEKLPGLVVIDADRRPLFVLPGSQVLRMLVSHYGGDTALARTIDEEHADQFWRELGVRAVTECVPPEKVKLAEVPADATLLEVAILMSRLRSPLVAVVDRDRRLVGCITLNALLDALALPDS
ncbi:CBS domain-containing protein [Propionibacteriaceae bacterium Y2011]